MQNCCSIDDGPLRLSKDAKPCCSIDKGRFWTLGFEPPFLLYLYIVYIFVQTEYFYCRAISVNCQYNNCWHHNWLGELRHTWLRHSLCRSSTASGVRHGWIENNTPSDWSQPQAVSTIIIRNTQEYTRNEIFELIIRTGISINNNMISKFNAKLDMFTTKFGILTAKLPRNLQFWPRNYREIDHFAISRYREIWRTKPR